MFVSPCWDNRKWIVWRAVIDTTGCPAESELTVRRAVCSTSAAAAVTGYPGTMTFSKNCTLFVFCLCKMIYYILGISFATLPSALSYAVFLSA
ncbi:hypothetical protein ElyMa_002732100 [Elysia marginata]|uniref:Uncharacterized protein n=1 Tax=Elysia marginata TaxID=1093978 RepID=A0AAV4HHK0_9GAST|nr:hypothetical protein ElyMa_002732100 [Elysia marginata]